MVKEHNKLQEKEKARHLDHFGKKRPGRSKWFLILFIVTVFLIVLSFWKFKSFSPLASESTSESEPMFTARAASKQKAADFLKKDMLGIAGRLVEEFPANDRLRILVVETHLVCLNYTQAKVLLEDGISLNPGYGEFYEKMARIASKDGKHDKAITCWKKALELSPERSDLNVKIAEAFMSSGEYRQVIGTLQKYIEILPESGFSYYLLGQAYLQLKEYDESKKYFEKAIEISPDHPQANYGLANVYIRLKQRDKAQGHMEVHQKWRQSRVNSRKAYASSDVTGVASDSLDKEFTLYAKYLTKLYLNGSGLYRADQNLEESEELLKRGEKAFIRAIEIAPKQPDLYRELSFMYIITGRNLTKTIKLAEKSVELKETAENYFVLYNAYNRNLDSGKALKALEKAIELDPSNIQYRQAYEMITKRRK